MKGKANAAPKPNIPYESCVAPDSADEREPASNEPSIGPVQENDTSARVNDIKNIPTTPPFSDFFSEVEIKLLGMTISKYPKKDIANKINTIKKVIFT